MGGEERGGEKQRSLLKTSRVKRHITYKGMVKMMAVFSSITMEARKQWNGIFKRDEKDKNLSKENL